MIMFTNFSLRFKLIIAIWKLQVSEFLWPCLFVLLLHIADCKSGKCSQVIHPV
jgi:hypothetical protein